MSLSNPDFSLASKRLIAKAVRQVLRVSENNTNVVRDAYPRGGAPAGFIWILIGAPTQDGDNKRWMYDWKEIEKTSEGYGGWTEKEGGLTNGGAWGKAYNLTEDGNDTGTPSSTYGNGDY